MSENLPYLTPEILVPRIGDYLVEKGLINSARLQAALERQRSLRASGQEVLLGEILVEAGDIHRQQLDTAVTELIIQLRSALQDANQQLQQANAHLEARVAERTADLQRALEKLTRIDQLRSNMVSNISHELRTPLTHIKGYLDLLGGADLGPLNAEQAQALGVIQRATGRLERLIEDLILYSLSEREELSVTVGEVDLVPVFARLANHFQPRASARQIRFECAQLLPDFPHVRADGEKITWVLEQLLDNAIKFTQPQGLVRVDAVFDHGMVCLTVQDTGIGIPAHRMQEIFEPFTQLDGSASRRFGGTGLGMALVQRILDAHGVTPHIESREGVGTSVSFELAPIRLS